MTSHCEFISSWTDQINCDAYSKVQPFSERADKNAGGTINQRETGL